MNLLTRLTTTTVASSPLHRIDTRLKLLTLLVCSVMVFFIDTWLGLGCVALLIVVLWCTAHLSFIALIEALKPCLVMALLVMAAHSLTFGSVHANAEVTQVLIGAPLELGWSATGALRGLYFVIRIFYLVLFFALFASTSSTAHIAAALTQIMLPLRRFGLPVHDMVTVTHIALRFIPQTGIEIDRIALAQRARGVHTHHRQLKQRIASWLPAMVALIVSLFHRADDLAYAMDARLYTGERRTYLGMKRPSFSQVIGAVGTMITMLLLGICC